MRPITVKAVAETTKKLIGDVEIEYKEERPVDFEEGVRRYIEWYKQTSLQIQKS